MGNTKDTHRLGWVVAVCVGGREIVVGRSVVAGYLGLAGWVDR